MEDEEINRMLAKAIKLEAIHLVSGMFLNELNGKTPLMSFYVAEQIIAMEMLGLHDRGLSKESLHKSLDKLLEEIRLNVIEILEIKENQ